MSDNSIDEERMPIIDSVHLGDILQGGPSVPIHEVSGEIPPMPSASDSVSSVPDKPSAPLAEEPQVVSPPLPNEGPDDEMKAQMVLPSEKEKERLRQQYGILRVVPMPYTRSDGKVQTYILRQLTRSNWRALEEQTRNVAEHKTVPPQEIFQEKIVASAVVWPPLPEHEIARSPAGLVPTLFGIIQQMGLFFDPEAIMSLTYVL